MAALLRTVDCVRLFVPELEAALQFYRDRLGHQLVWRTEQAVGLRLPDSTSEIVLHTEPLPLEVDFLVDSADDAAVQFEAAGGKIIVPPFEIQIGRAVVVEDPWNNQYVLLDMSKGLLVTDNEGRIISNQ